mgnify:CR=1 FL=1
MRRLLILVAALALLTTACKIEINAEFVINADKTGEVVLEFGYDDEVAQLAAANGSSPTEMLGDFDLEDVPGATVTTETRGDMTFQVITVPIDDVTQAEGLGGDLADGLTDDFQISFTDERVTIRGATTLDDALGEDTGEMGLTPEMLAQFFEINVRVTMPGKILEHNADSQSGNTLTWNIDLTGGALDIFAESDPNASEGSSMLLYVLIGAGAVLLVLVLWYLMRRKGGGTAAAAPAAAPAPAADSPPPAPPPSE